MNDLLRQQQRERESERSFHEKKQATEPSSQELIKQLYRKLARSLHPDVQENQQSTGYRRWLTKAWETLQKAYHRQDLAGLQKLDVSILLRTQQLDRLTMAELNYGLQFLQEEFQGLQQESRDIRKSPAWNFTRKRNYASAEAKVRKELALQIKELEMELSELQRERMLLEVLSRKRPKKNKKAFKTRRKT